MQGPSPSTGEFRPPAPSGRFSSPFGGPLEQETTQLPPVPAQHQQQQQFQQPPFIGRQDPAAAPAPVPQVPQHEQQAPPSQPSQAQLNGYYVPPQHQQQYGAGQQYGTGQHHVPGTEVAQNQQAGVSTDLVHQLGVLGVAPALSSVGWRAFLNRFPGFALGLSPAEIEERRLYASIRRMPTLTNYKVAVIVRKGGAGRGVIAAGLGLTEAQIRGGDVVVVDATSDGGDIDERTAKGDGGVGKLLLKENYEEIKFRADVEKYAGITPEGLRVLGSQYDLNSTDQYSHGDHTDVLRQLDRFFNITISDTGKDLLTEASRAVLETANTVIIPVMTTLPGALAAEKTVKWLRNHHFEHLLERTIIVINHTTKEDHDNAKPDAIRQYFEKLNLKVHEVPFDEHIAQGTQIRLESLAPKTRRAFLELAASVADHYAADRHEGLR
ncbi:hypothetical protein TSHO111613_17080 [Tsukamurella hominis]